MKVKVLLIAMLAFAASTAIQAAPLIDNSTVTILPSSSLAYGGYDAIYALDYLDSPLDTVPNYSSDYASAGQGASTHLDFKFQVPETFTSIQYTDRTTSGSTNFTSDYGTRDYVTSYELIFANNSSFTNPVGIYYSGPLTVPADPTSYLDFQHTATPANPITAQYVEWQVLSTNPNGNSDNPGASNFAFYGTSARSAVPEPTSLIIWSLLGAVGLGLGWWRKRKAA